MKLYILDHNLSSGRVSQNHLILVKILHMASFLGLTVSWIDILGLVSLMKASWLSYDMHDHAKNAISARFSHAVVYIGLNNLQRSLQPHIDRYDWS